MRKIESFQMKKIYAIGHALGPETEAKMSFIYWCRALQVRIP